MYSLLLVVAEVVTVTEAVTRLVLVVLVELSNSHHKASLREHLQLLSVLEVAALYRAQILLRYLCLPLVEVMALAETPQVVLVVLVVVALTLLLLVVLEQLDKVMRAQLHQRHHQVVVVVEPQSQEIPMAQAQVETEFSG
jgi:IS4 transposase